MHRRGRSPVVSPVALARQAAEQRNTVRISSQPQDPFQYAFMPPSTFCAPKPSKKLPTRHNRSVSLKDVLTSMRGRLFPLDPSERADDARRIAAIASPPHPRKSSVRAALLHNLLHVDSQQQVSQSAKRTVAECPKSPSSLTSSPSPSRSSSWLSFGSWRSTATDITPPDSPASPSSISCLLPTPIDTQPQPHPRSSYARISVEQSPLSPPTTPHHQPTPLQDPSPASDSPLASQPISLVKHVTQSVVDAAKGLQSACIAATSFVAGPCVTPSHPHGPPRCQRQARRQGYRALAQDVKKFTASATPVIQISEPVHFIPLLSPPSAAAHLPKPPLGPKNAIIFPSPLRPRTPPAALAYRMRPIANPATLRLRALQNLMYARGKEWEGRAREGALGCGKERMLGIAFEGRRRSGLGCEVRFVVA